MPNRSYTDWYSSACDRTLGAVMPLVWPSWLIPMPLMTPWIGSPSASARSSGFSTTTPTPSDMTNPSAAASKARHCPRGGEHAHRRRQDQVVEGAVDGDPAGQREVAVARDQAAASLVDRDQRGRAGGVEAYARAR